MSDTPSGCAPLKLTPENHAANWDVPSQYKKSDHSYYFGFFKPAFCTYELPEGSTYEIELIDAWDMTVRKLLGTYTGSIKSICPKNNIGQSGCGRSDYPDIAVV